VVGGAEEEEVGQGMPKKKPAIADGLSHVSGDEEGELSPACLKAISCVDS
jgi:hypothetical protein